jgi:NTP pyrophosphatase (non-canonical NTP hydrolase)
MRELAKIILENVRRTNTGGTEQAQVYAIGEEAGEFIGAMRRWRGMARRSGTEAAAKAELADIVISSFVMAEIMGWDLDDLIRQKAEIILSRGWKAEE